MAHDEVLHRDWGARRIVLTRRNQSPARIVGEPNAVLP
jgi:hypothetical protein